MRRVGYLLVALITVAVLASLDLTRLWATLSTLTLRGVLELLTISMTLIAVSAVKWKLFLEHLGSKVGFLKLCALYLLGYYVNFLLPSFAGGDVVRSYYAGAKGERHTSVAATFLERYTGLIAMLVLGAGATFFVPEELTWVGRAVLVFAFAVVAIAVACLSEFPLFVTDRIRFLKRFSPFVQKVREGLLLGIRAPRLLLEAFFLSFVFHGLTIVNTAVCAVAIGWHDPGLVELMVVVPLILLIGAVPLTPSGIGLQEGAFYLFLPYAGATPEQALAVGLVLRAKNYVLALLGFFVFLRLHRNSDGDSERNSKGDSSPGSKSPFDPTPQSEFPAKDLIR